MAGKFTWGNRAKHCWVMSTNFLFSKVCRQPPAMFSLKPAHNLNFPWRRRWWDWNRLFKMFSTLRPNIFYITCVITFAIRTRLESGTKREMTILIMLCFVLPYVAYKHEIDQIRCVACSQCTMMYFVAFHFQAHNVSTLWFEKTFWYRLIIFRSIHYFANSAKIWQPDAFN